MPSNLMDRRFYLCTGQCVLYKDLYKYPESHILGELIYVTDNSRKVTALALYEVSTCADEVPPLLPDVIMQIVGDGMGIKCRHNLGTPRRCKNERRWELSRSGFLAMLDRMGYQDQFLKLEERERKT